MGAAFWERKLVTLVGEYYYDRWLNSEVKVRIHFLLRARIFGRRWRALDI